MQPPTIIIHRIPPKAREEAKTMLSILDQLKEDASEWRWFGIEANDFTLDYNYRNGDTTIKLCLTDAKNNRHIFMVCLYDDTFGETGLPSMQTCEYLFKPNKDVSCNSSASLATHIKEEFLRFDEHFDIVADESHCSIKVALDNAFITFATMLDMAVNKIQSVEKLYTLFQAKFLPLLWEEAAMGRWKGIKPYDFKCSKDDEQTSIYITYHVADVWDIEMSLAFINNEDGCYMCCGYDVFLYEGLSESAKGELTKLSNSFLLSINHELNDNIWCPGSSDLEYIQMEIFTLEEAVGEFCNMLDVIIPAFWQYHFQLSVPPTELTGELAALKERLEITMGATFDVLSEAQEINNKLKCGKFE